MVMISPFISAENCGLPLGKAAYRNPRVHCSKYAGCNSRRRTRKVHELNSLGQRTTVSLTQMFH